MFGSVLQVICQPLGRNLGHDRTSAKGRYGTFKLAHYIIGLRYPPSTNAAIASRRATVPASA
jgi:hypothetical protein